MAVVDPCVPCLSPRGATGLCAIRGVEGSGHQDPGKVLAGGVTADVTEVTEMDDPGRAPPTKGFGLALGQVT
jgi:hypothetical protein